MNAIHPVIAQSMAWFAPPYAEPSINDDNIYVAEYHGKHGWKIVKDLGCSSASADCAKRGLQTVGVGQALFRGMTLKHLPLWGAA
ncbi:MAG: hypothetical protein ACRCVX_16390 [Shewanella sp.]